MKKKKRKKAKKKKKTKKSNDDGGKYMVRNTTDRNMAPYYKGLDVQFYVSLPGSSPAFQLHIYAMKEVGMSLGTRHFLHLKLKLLSLVVP